MGVFIVWSGDTEEVEVVASAAFGFADHLPLEEVGCHVFALGIIRAGGSVVVEGGLADEDEDSGGDNLVFTSRKGESTEFIFVEVGEECLEIGGWIGSETVSFGRFCEEAVEDIDILGSGWDLCDSNSGFFGDAYIVPTFLFHPSENRLFILGEIDHGGVFFYEVFVVSHFEAREWERREWFCLDENNLLFFREFLHRLGENLITFLIVLSNGSTDDEKSILSETDGSFLEESVGEEILFLIYPDEKTLSGISGFSEHELPFDGLPDRGVGERCDEGSDIFLDIGREIAGYFEYGWEHRVG